jgi:hypothetical protein
MRLGTVAGGSGFHSPTVYTVLAGSARSHSRRYLAAEASLAGAAAAAILAWRPLWWPVASLALAVGLYAGWGLLALRDAHPERGPATRVLRTIVAGIATAATLAGLGGLAVKAFWGTAPGPYGVCYQPDGKSYACDVNGQRRSVSRPPT